MDNLFNFLIAVLAPLIVSGVIYLVKEKFRIKREINKFLQELGVTTKERLVYYTKYYVRPDCCSTDPCQENDDCNPLITCQRLFDKMDEFLSSSSFDRKHLFLLSDTGMGKTAFMLNYYVRNLRRKGERRRNLKFVSLTRKGADQKINEIKDRRNVTLFLDAFDDDLEAQENHRRRINNLMDLCNGFNRVVITCRTQFFTKDEEIPTKSTIVVTVPRPLGESKTYEFLRLYLAPFNDKQVRNYLYKVYPKFLFLFTPKRFFKAVEVLKKIKVLSKRPMILSYIPILLESETGQLNNRAQLYDAIVRNWLKREKIENAENMLRFLQKLAKELHLNRKKRGGEFIPCGQLEYFAKQWEFKIPKFDLSAHSLLNHDALGNYKFVHRTIREYLFAREFYNEPCDNLEIDWTPMMSEFFIEISRDTEGRVILNNVKLYSADLSKQDLSGALLNNVTLTGTNFSWANLTGMVINNGHLGECVFEGAVLKNAVMADVNLSRVVFKNAFAEGITLKRCELHEANMNNADFNFSVLENVVLKGAYLNGIKFYHGAFPSMDFSGLGLEGVDFRASNLEHSNFEKAILRNADFRGANLDYANLTNADTSGIEYNSSTLLQGIKTTDKALVQVSLQQQNNMSRSRSFVQHV